MKKIHIKKGDLVKIIAGENKGQQGKVLKVNRQEYSAIVEGVNIIHKHTKPNAKYTQGGIIEKEAPIHISNIQVVDSKGNATKIGRKVDENKRIIRYSKKSGEELK